MKSCRKLHTTTSCAGSQRGSIIIEGLLAMLIFSIGILALVGLQAVATKQVSASKYRTDSSLLADQIISQMWISDKTAANLQAQFGSPNGAQYPAWVSSVQAALPGVTAASGTLPTVTIDGNNNVTVTLQWVTPGEATANSYTAVTVVKPQ